MATAYLILNDFDIALKTPYDPGFVAALKNTVPGHERKWDPVAKLWTVDHLWRREVENLCRIFYGAVEVIDKQSRRYETPRTPLKAGTGDWAAQLFASTPKELHEKIYRALSRVLHPDVGGDTEAMKALNIANDKRPQ